MKKRILTLFLVFLVILMPISYSLSLYVSLNEDGQVRVSQNSCNYGNQKGVIFLPDLGEHDTRELAIEDANFEITSSSELKGIYQEKGYSVQIIPLAQSDENVLNVYKKYFGKIPDVKESINLFKNSFEDNNVKLIALFGHGGRNEEFNLKNFDLYRKSGKYNVIEQVSFLPGVRDLILRHSTYKEEGYSASLEKSEDISIKSFNKQIEYYNCGLIGSGGIFAPALPWIVSQRRTMGYNELVEELNKLVSGQESRLSPPADLKVGEKDECKCRYDTLCPLGKIGVDCSQYTEDKINEIKEKSVKDIKDDDVDYLIGALQCDSLVALAAKSIGDIAHDGAADLTKDHPITHTIEPLVGLTKFDRDNLENYNNRIDDIIYALFFVVANTESDISAYINDDFIDNILIAPDFNKESTPYVIALLGIIAEKSEDFTALFLKYSRRIWPILDRQKRTMNEDSASYLVYGIDKILNKVNPSDSKILNIRDEYFAIQNMVEILSKSLDYESSRKDAIKSIYLLMINIALTPQHSQLLPFYFFGDVYTVEGFDKFYLFDRLIIVMDQGDSFEKGWSFFSIYNFFQNVDFLGEYKSHLNTINKLDDFKNTLRQFSTTSKGENNEARYLPSLALMLVLLEPDDLSQFDLKDSEIEKLSDYIGAFGTLGYIAKRNLPLLNKDFNEIYGKLSYINEDYKKYSLAMSVWRYMSKTKKNVDESINYITNIRASFVDREILGPNKNLIVFTHNQKSGGTFTRPDGSTFFSYRFDNSNIIGFAKETGVLDENIKKDDVEEGDTYFKGPNDKKDILKAISLSNGETVIWFRGHGSKDALWLSDEKSIDFTELGNALKDRDDLGKVIVIIDACFSYDFAQNLYDNLDDIEYKPTIITETNRDSYGYSGANYIYESTDKSISSYEESFFLSSIIKTYIDSGRIGHLRGKQIIDAEKYAFDKQDSAIFFGGENPVEIASNKIGKSECGMCEEGVCPV